jgi:anti-sigma factor RsiW
MNHPYELLADLVDGSLDADHRAQVDAHLATCAACREDVDAATAGRAAAQRLPREPAPVGLHDRVVAAATGGGSLESSPRWYRWAGVAAAAAVVVAIAIALPNVGGSGQAERATGDAAGANAPAPNQGAAAEILSGDKVPLEVHDTDYGEAGLERLAVRIASDHATAASSDGVSRDPAPALRCVARAFGPPEGRLARLIQARFHGREAYLAVYLEGPGADQPPDLATVYVASRNDCSLLTLASAQR